METVTEERVIDALRKVQDPERHRDIVSLGMVKNLSVAQGVAPTYGGRPLGRIGLLSGRHAAGHRRCPNHFFTTVKGQRRFIGRHAAERRARRRGAGEIHVR